MNRPGILRKLSLVLALAVSAGAMLPAWASDASVRWGFVLNFSRYTEWPAQKWSSPSAYFNICLLPGDREMAVELYAIEKLSISGRTLRGVSLSRPQEMEPCAVVYLPSEYKGPIKPVIELAEKHRILLISDRAGFAEEGGMIELFPSAGRYAFDINLLATRSAELKLSSHVLKLARTVK